MGSSWSGTGRTILDVGGESTRPGAEEVGAEEEIARTEPVISDLAGLGHTVSIDTSKLAVAEAALDAGAAIVNDVTALRGDPEIAALCAEREVGLILMHMQGTPRTMQDDPTYEDVVDDVKAFLAERIEFAVAAGVSERRIWLDPGIGFGKTARAQPRAAAPARRAARARLAARRRHLAQELHRQDRRLARRPPRRRHDRLLDPRRRRGRRRAAGPRRRRGGAGGQGRDGDPRVG